MGTEADDFIDSGTPVTEPTARESETFDDWVDKGGNQWDSNVYQLKDGKPWITSKGFFARKPGKRPGKAPKQENISSIGGVAGDNNIVSAFNPSQAGRTAADMTFLIGQGIGGEEWAPIVNAEYGVNEPLMLTEAYTKYFAAKGIIDDIPPGWLLVITLGMYAAPRLRQPKTKSRLSLAVAWCKNKFSRKGGKGDAARDNSRPNGVGENVKGERSSKTG